MNKLLALLLFVLLAPIWLITGIVVFSALGRPILFSQIRVGLHGSTFHILKFRTMKGGDVPVFNQKQYLDRTTSTTRLIRKFKFDEIPQLLNVILGDMNFIGPRPLPKGSMINFRKEISCERCSVLPGIFGLSQVLSLDHTAPCRRMCADLYMIRNNSFCLRIYIFLMLVRRLIFGAGEQFGERSNS